MEENQRVRLTKKMLKDSFLNLFKKKNIQKISIKEICDLAQINRSTFYKYYSTEYDLLKDIENEHLLAMQEFLKLTDSNLAILKILKYIDQNADFFKLILDTLKNIDFLDQLLPVCFSKMNYVDKFEKYKTTTEQEYMFQFLIYGCINVIKKWLFNERRESLQEMTLILDDLISKFFKIN